MANHINPVRVSKTGAPRIKRRGFAFGSRGPVTVLDIDGRTLRLVQTTRRGGTAAISRFAAANLEPSTSTLESDPEAIGKSVSEALDGLRIKAGQVVMAVPRGLVFLRTLLLPAASTTGELASMVQFQISKDLPFRLDEAVVDFTVLRFLSAPSSITADAPNKAGQNDGSENRDPSGRAEGALNLNLASTPGEAARPTDGTGENLGPIAAVQTATSTKVEVLVAVVKKDIVERYVRLAAAAGCKLTSLGLRSCANARCIGVRAGSNGQQSVALVSLRSDEATIELVVDQAVVFSRVAEAAQRESGSKPDNEEKSADGTSPPPRTDVDFIAAVTTELVRSLHSYESSAGHCPVEKILVTGGTGKEPALVEALSHRFRVPCEIFAPAVAFGLGESEKENGAGALAVFGLAFGVNDAEGLPFDFLNPKRPPTPRNWPRIKIFAGAGAGVILLLTLTGVRSHWIGNRTQIKEQVQAQVTQAEKIRPLFRDLRLKAKAVRDWTLEKRNWLDHYALLSSLLPPSQDLYITSLSTGARGTIHLSVQARSGEVLAQMDKRLREAGYEVKPLAITPGVDKHGFPFRTSVELTLTDKMKTDLKALAAPLRPQDDAAFDSPTGAGKSADARAAINSVAPGAPPKGNP